MFMSKTKLREKDLDMEFLKECFNYHSGGYFTWKERPLHHFSTDKVQRGFNTRFSGEIAGYFNKRTDSQQEGFGYWRVGISREGALGHFKLHRLIWFWNYGYFPEVVDHIDNDTQNNNISNLRECTGKDNSRNLKLSVNNTTGYKGVSITNDPKRRNKPFRASIEYNGYVFGLGGFSCEHVAALAYNKAAELFFKDFSKLNDVPDGYEFYPKGIFFTKYYYEIKDNSFDWSTRKKRKRTK